ncbi:MAG TPA: iron-sulfur cluster repair di-iron protein [Terriglobales bacterium]|nr:iron-sulfur cluster repair di-iron protein [Terriglobales bacterium]
MNVDTTQTVREMALNIPAATRVFEKLGIDYCCGGNKSLEQACGEAHLEIQRVLDSLETAANTAETRQSGEAYQVQPLAELIDHIKSTHHKYTREEIARLGPLFDKVCNVHGPKHPELLEMRHDFRALAQELTTHMMKEEMVLFPYIERMEEAVVAGEPILPAPFGTVSNPVAMMIHEHDTAGNLLRNLRARSDGYQPPENACVSYKTLFSALEEFERDLHLHIHLENNILFPRAIAMEREK